MPAISQRQLVQAVLDAIFDSGYSGVLVSGLGRHPQQFVIRRREGDHLTLWVYIHTATPGGRRTLPHEYRIQLTSFRSPLRLNPDGLTVLVGYEPNLKLFAGFDVERHRTFTEGSSSVQIDVRPMRQALQDGLALDRKANQEIAVGVRPDQFVGYCLSAKDLHKYARHAATSDLLVRASSLQQIPEQEIAQLAVDRQRVVHTVTRLAREAHFREQVLRAYGHRCAVTGVQLRLVEAAHLLPVGAPGSVDDVRNGIALSPTYHRAYDRGLIYLDTDFRMKVSQSKVRELVELRRDDGLVDFRAPLGKILLPPDRRQWPATTFIAKANRFRNV
jgi:putative restriction endonuclease